MDILAGMSINKVMHTPFVVLKMPKTDLRKIKKHSKAAFSQCRAQQVVKQSNSMVISCCQDNKALQTPPQAICENDGDNGMKTRTIYSGIVRGEYCLKIS